MNVGCGGVLGFFRDRVVVYSSFEFEFVAFSSVGLGVFDCGVVGVLGLFLVLLVMVILLCLMLCVIFVSVCFVLDDEDFCFFFEDASSVDFLELVLLLWRILLLFLNVLSVVFKCVLFSVLMCFLIVLFMIFMNVVYFASLMSYVKCAFLRLSVRMMWLMMLLRVVDLYLFIMGWIF